MSTPRDELAADSEVGHVYLRQLVRAQLLLSLTALLAFGGLLAALPVALAVLPGLHREQLLGVPVTLLVIGPPLLAAFVALGWLYARRADALDAQFAELVEERRP